MASGAILYPVMALVGWTLVMWVWMYATRIPAIISAKIDVDELTRTGQPLVLPPHVARVANNYNHLHEQPTIFYALVLAAAFLGAVDSIQIGLAWTYVGIRVVHSVIQAGTSLGMARFVVFVLGCLVLIALLLRTFSLIA